MSIVTMVTAIEENARKGRAGTMACCSASLWRQYLNAQPYSKHAASALSISVKGAITASRPRRLRRTRHGTYNQAGIGCTVARHKAPHPHLHAWRRAMAHGAWLVILAAWQAAERTTSALPVGTNGVVRHGTYVASWRATAAQTP